MTYIKSSLEVYKLLSKYNKKSKYKVDITDIISDIAANSEGLISQEEIQWKIDETIADISVYLPYEKTIIIKWSVFEKKPQWEQRVILAHGGLDSIDCRQKGYLFFFENVSNSL